MSRSKMPFISLRLNSTHHKKPALLDELLGVLAQHRASTDEIWLASDYGFPTLEVHRHSAECMAQAAEKIRRAGFVVSLQISNTLGHGNVEICPSDGIAWQRMVGHEGEVAPRCNCPRSEGLHAYLRESTTAYCLWQPDAVWIDDDLRMQSHNPVGFGCFCEGCLAAFSAQEGRAWDRPGLVAAITSPRDGVVRAAWIRFNRQSLAGIARVVSEAAHAVAPRCMMAIQQCGLEWGVYSGPDYEPILAAMSEVTGRPSGSRPGHGCYTDHAPRAMLLKAFYIARQNSRLPQDITVIRPEVENHVHTAMGKSPHGTVVESTLGLAMGCTGLSYATLMIEHEPPSWHAGTLQRVAAWRPFMERYVRQNAGTRPGGLEVAFGPNHGARALRPGEQPMAWASTSFDRVYLLSTLGLPLAMSRDYSSAALLTAEASDGLSEAELRELFGRGVVTDGATIERLQERGLEGLTGLRAESFDKMDVWEELTDDALNGTHVGRRWMQNIFAGTVPTHRLNPLAAAKARVLGRYVTPAGEARGHATVAVETPLGGRLVAFGYNAWEHVVSGARRFQLLSAADWASGGALPAVIETTAQVVAVPRVERGGNLRSVLLLNVSIDHSPELTVRLRGAAGDEATWIEPTRRTRRLAATRNSTGDLTVSVPSLPPWSPGYVLLAKG